MNKITAGRHDASIEIAKNSGVFFIRQHAKSTVIDRMKKLQRTIAGSIVRNHNLKINFLEQYRFDRVLQVRHSVVYWKRD
ncbi:MAG: hypothetical protein WDN48_16465 [Pseudolabrys sp.]